MAYENDDRPQSTEGVVQAIRAFRRALTAAELAKILAVSDGTVYRMTASSSLPYFRVRGSVRFDPSALIQWLKKQGLS